DFSRAAYEVARNAPHRVLPPQEGAMIDRVRTLFGRRVDEIEPEQRAFAAEFAGLDSVRSPAELAALIAEAEAAYRSETPFRRRLQLQARSSARRLWNSRPW
ncbi:MAG: hypothetical protein ACRDLK_00540, partial [Gaiellaceae bacterium]